MKLSLLAMFWPKFLYNVKVYFNQTYDISEEVLSVYRWVAYSCVADF